MSLKEGKKTTPNEMITSELLSSGPRNDSVSLYVYIPDMPHGFLLSTSLHGAVR